NVSAVAAIAANLAAGGENVVWIRNTVDHARLAYRAINSQMCQDAFDRVASFPFRGVPARQLSQIEHGRTQETSLARRTVALDARQTGTFTCRSPPQRLCACSHTSGRTERGH